MDGKLTSVYGFKMHFYINNYTTTAEPGPEPFTETECVQNEKCVHVLVSVSVCVCCHTVVIVAGDVNVERYFPLVAMRRCLPLPFHFFSL